MKEWKKYIVKGTSKIYYQIIVDAKDISMAIDVAKATDPEKWDEGLASIHDFRITSIQEWTKEG